MGCWCKGSVGRCPSDGAAGLSWNLVSVKPWVHRGARTSAKIKHVAQVKSPHSKLPSPNLTIPTVRSGMRGYRLLLMRSLHPVHLVSQAS